MFGSVDDINRDDTGSLYQKISDYVSSLTMSKNAQFYDKTNDKYLLIEIQTKENVKSNVCIYNNSYISITDKELADLQEKGSEINVISRSVTTITTSVLLNIHLYAYDSTKKEDRYSCLLF